ncbi:hypothetical protein LCGC14_3088480, partial [marine sediment metagenome]
AGIGNIAAAASVLMRDSDTLPQDTAFYKIRYSTSLQESRQARIN